MNIEDLPLYYEPEALKRLKLQSREFARLLEVGIFVPVGRCSSGAPLYSAEAIDRFSKKEERERLTHALWWDFQLQRPGYLPADAPWARAADLPFYPFDNKQQFGWARRVYWSRRWPSTIPYPRPDLMARFKMKREDEATRAFEKASGIKRPRKRRLIYIGKRGVPVTRAQLRDLVWSKTMIRAAADLLASEFTLRQACEKYRIPTPPRGHFNQKNPKDRAPKPTLNPREHHESA